MALWDFTQLFKREARSTQIPSAISFLRFNLQGVLDPKKISGVGTNFGLLVLVLVVYIARGQYSNTGPTSL
jgi:hypothetical protein